ncbi:MAG: hypothetical protein P4L55_04450 [Syntrophobacteraceae bacterium]|nr:hypothetical protein [Syntrophobacteraceae bacterium]
MEVYIIRIYRRDDADSRLLAGFVEQPEEQQSRAFANIDELLDLLGLRSAFLKHKMKTGQTAR